MTHGTAIIVGAGPGLGAALATAFADAGYPVALLARSPGKLDDILTPLHAQGHQARAYTADAADPPQLRTALITAFSELGAPEVLVYNAALLRGDSPTDGDTEGWISALAVDVIGAKVAAETVLPALRDKRGSLLFTGGGLAMTPSPEYASLSVGKAALRTYVQTLHAQQVGTEVHATSVTIFGKIGGKEPRFAPDVIARHYLELHRQPQPTWQDELVLD